ncbi:monovalent cation/H+ antiporter subunit D family protein [Nocardiopsis sp. MG754419]|uniref:monovalent cation/H+ antiporter subunit D family protein n=1 Tax=Nocardiopsis sp. MG754419 TaxID=2259865 RepID=UPI001BAC3311|nr:monovalent cation/H+ antiporter subunit D family protein [Nocardiopsis sp. MG754419]MBR8743886.1 monovalent cation/H+ antiporter subunit D family protein [Nocardiopsis sp. MG754419]
MIPALLPLFVGVPLLGAGLLVVVRGPLWVRRALLLAPSTAAMLGGAGLIWLTRDGTVYAHNVGLWQDGIAIPFVADVFSALMLWTTSLLALVCSLFAVATGDDRQSFFAPLVLVLTAGVSGALLTADIFNMFVFIEVMLLPSYGLLAMLGALGRLRAGRIYVTVNLLTSTIFLAGVALVYAAAGTVHLGELAGAAHESPMVAVGMGVVILALSIKAAVVPVHGWLTRTYPGASPAITALFSGLHTKVAIYAIYRLYALVFDGDAKFLWIGVVAFTLTMLIGVMGAVGENTTRSILVFHMISQIGYILLGVALFTELGLMAGIFYLIHHMIVKASLFLSTGAIEHTHGTGALDRLGGIARREPLIGLVFMGAALSLAGLPPFSGFVAKLSLVLAAVESQQWTVMAVMIAVSLITLMSMLKIWGGVFWGKEPPVAEPDDTSTAGANGGSVRTAAPPRIRTALILPGLMLTVATLCIGLGAELLLDLSAQAAANLLDTSTYVEAVLGR